MKKSLSAAVIVALLLTVEAPPAGAGDDGPAPSGCAQKPCGAPAMKTCKEIVFEEQQRTFYKPVYKEVMEERVINTVQFVEETRYRCQPCTIWQPKPAGGCGSCGPADCCAPQKPCEMVPVQTYKKVAYKVMVQKPIQKKEPVPRTVVTMEPYTVTICIPHVICKQVPVCNPMPCRCKKKGCRGGCRGK